jgi:cytochrome P450
MPDYGRVWIITRYANVRAALTDPRLANKVCHWPGGGRSFPDEAAGVHALLNTDPPDHTRLRPLVQKAFTPRRAGQLRARTKEITAGLLDEMTAHGAAVTCSRRSDWRAYFRLRPRACDELAPGSHGRPPPHSGLPRKPFVVKGNRS